MININKRLFVFSIILLFFFRRDLPPVVLLITLQIKCEENNQEKGESGIKNTESKHMRRENTITEKDTFEKADSN